MTNQLILVGGGGHCKSCIEVIESTAWRIAGIVDKETGSGELNGYKFLGSDDILPELVEDGYAFLITVGQIKNASIRKKLFEQLKASGALLASPVSPTAIVSKHASVGEGSIIMHHAIVNASAKVGDNCIINNKALIEHDAIIGNHCHISTGAILNGDCRIGEGVFIGSHAVIAQGIKICDDAIVGAGAVVIRDITTKGTYAGNPASMIGQ